MKAIMLVEFDVSEDSDSSLFYNAGGALRQLLETNPVVGPTNPYVHLAIGPLAEETLKHHKMLTQQPENKLDVDPAE